MGEVLAAVCGFMTAVSFVKDVLDIWDNVAMKRRSEAATAELAAELETFGLEDARQELQLHLEVSQAIMKDRSSDDKRRDQLARRFETLFGILESLPKAVDDVLAIKASTGAARGRKSLRFRKLFPPGLPGIAYRGSPFETLETKVASFDSCLKKFNRLVMTMKEVTRARPGEPLLLTTEDLQFCGERNSLPGANGTITTCEASHARSGGSLAETLSVIVESISYQSGTQKELELRLRTLAGKLQRALPAEHIPRLLGYQQDDRNKVFNIVFKRPIPDQKFVGLANIYADGTPEPSLNIRLQLCRQLAVAVLQAHTLGLVHKQIRPENLLLAATKDDDRELAEVNLFLCGWKTSRITVGAATRKVGETSPGRLIYQHPDRHGKDGSLKDYKILYDIYSLGVCMLEILTWDPLVRPGTRLLGPPELSASYRDMFEKLGYHRNNCKSDDNDGDDDDGESIAKRYVRNGAHVRETLVAMAKLMLPKKVGVKVATLVTQCLHPRDIVEDADALQISERFDTLILEDLDKVLANI